MTRRLLIATSALFLGGLIYISCRSETLLMFASFEGLGLRQAISSIRRATACTSAALPLWTIYSLPNALWLFSGLLIIEEIWGSQFKGDKSFWLASLWLLAFGSEFAQGVGLLPGTFDWQDVAWMCVATVLAFLWVNCSREQNGGAEA